MKTADIVELVSEEMGLSRVCVSGVMEAYWNLVMKSLIQGHKVTIHGFGHFRSRVIPEMMGRNPWKNEPMMIPERLSISFLVSKHFKDRVKKEYESAPKRG